MYSSKDWSFNQILAYLWSFLSISAFVTINFYNLALKQEKSIMAKLNRIRVVLAEHDLNNKWLADKLERIRQLFPSGSPIPLSPPLKPSLQ